MENDTPKALGALQVDETKLMGHVHEVVRSSVEETLNALLDAEADEICGAKRYERSPDRVDTRAGHYERTLETKAGAVTLKMYLAGVSVRRVEDITEALWGTRVSSGTVSRLNQRIYRHIEAWRNREIVGDFPYVYLDGVILKRSWSGEVKNVSVLVAIGVGADGFRQILGVAEGEKEDLEGWRGFLRHLKDRGLNGVRLIISDACRGLVEAIGEEAIHAQEDRAAAQAKTKEVAARLKMMKLRRAADLVEQKAIETLTYYSYPSNHWRQIRTSNPLERIIREIRRRTRVVGAFPDGTRH